MGRRKGRPAPRWLGSLFLLIGIGLQAGGGVMAVRMGTWLNSSVAASGTVVDLEKHRGRRGRSTYAEVVEFTTAEGRDVRFTNPMSSSSPFAKNQAVPVLYNPASPSDAMIDTTFRRWFPAGLLLGMGIFFAIFGVVIRAAKR